MSDEVRGKVARDEAFWFAYMTGAARELDALGFTADACSTNMVLVRVHAAGLLKARWA